MKPVPLIMASPRNTLIALAALILALLLVFDRGVEWWRQRRAVDAATAPLIDKVVVTTGIIEDGAKADADRADDDANAAQAANTFRTDIERSRRNDPEARARADRPVPRSVRDAFRARRIAIERSGCAAGECDPPAPGADAAER